MKKFFKWVGITIGSLMIVLVMMNIIGAEGGDFELVSMVQTGKLEWCPDYTVKQMADGFMAWPIWEPIKADDGGEYVNLIGGITLQGKPVEAVAQFKVDRKAGTFAFQAFELNGIPQNLLVQRELIQGMCESASK